MRASERLRELDGAMVPAGDAWPAGEDGGTLGLAGGNLSAVSTLRNALPLIADVVEAAEAGRDHSLLLQSNPAGVEMVGWRVDHAQALNTALTALSSALEGGDVT